MDTATENQDVRSRPTGLPKPGFTSLLRSPPRNQGLAEMSDAAANSRGAMGPPPIPMGSIKHKPTGLPEPESKVRKTLAERGGECGSSKIAAPPMSRSINGAVKNALMNGTRPFQGTASLSRAQSQKAAKHGSTNSFGASVGHASRATSANGYGSRPKSAYGTHNRSRSQQQSARPATSYDQHEEVGVSERKGAQPLSISTNQGDLEILKVRKNPAREPKNVSRPGALSLHVPRKGSLQMSAQRATSSPSRLYSTSPVLDEPADYDPSDILEGFGALTLTPSAERGRTSRDGRGSSSGEPTDISLKSKASTSMIPRATPRKPMAPPPPPSPKPKTPSRPQTPAPPFLSRFTNDRCAAFDDSRVASLEAQFETFQKEIQRDMAAQSSLKDSIKQYEMKNAELEVTSAQYRTLLEEHKTEIKDLKSLLSTTNMELETVRRSHSFEVDDLRRKHRNEVDDLESQHRKESERSRRDNECAAEKVRKDFEAQIEKLLKMHTQQLEEMEKRLKIELEEERSKRSRDAAEVQAEFALKLRNAALEADTREREAQLVQGELTNVKAELDRERMLKTGLQGQLTQATSQNLTLEASNKAMMEKINFLESDSQAQSSAFNELHRRMQEAIEAAELANEKLRQEETLRRKLHNQVQELKGNIRVMCRVRPKHDFETDPANIGFPDRDTDSKEVAVQGPEKTSAMGTNITQTHSYSFDRVFGPSSQNAEVFEEISQLVQSALDGYNVCIFCYGQTGSGKTFTMSSADGMIPRATAQIYAEATRLEEKGWRYKMEGSFVEVYNETYNDLLGRSEDLDKKKVEVRHDTAKKQTTLENAVTVELDGPHRVEEIMERASKNRSVAATKANMRSSRSHSVFILKLVGENSITGEKSQGTLNLVDLAGSERLEHSKAEGARLKETQNINKSLSCLGDVINALGSAKEGTHIPYRNSKLTYLLQYSLGGNSKTLMFVMVSPLQAHLQETITSLKFATKVHNTHIGTAKRQTKA